MTTSSLRRKQCTNQHTAEALAVGMPKVQHKAENSPASGVHPWFTLVCACDVSIAIRCFGLCRMRWIHTTKTMAFTGCRPLTLEEQEKVHQALESKRDKALFTLQLKCGFRISELLSLRVKDVCTIAAVIQAAEAKQEEKKDSKNPMRESEHARQATMFQCISVQRKHAKKKLKGRTVPLNPKAQLQLKQWIEEAQLKPDDFLFPPWTNHHEAKLTTTRPIHYHSAWRIYKKAFAKCGIVGPAHTLGTHVGRKCFAKKMKDKLGNIEEVAKALGHESISSTQHYLKFDQDRIHKAILDDD
jgi:integrase